MTAPRAKETADSEAQIRQDSRYRGGYPNMSSDPKKLRILKPVAVSALFALVFAAGCGRMSAGELRLQGIEELEAGNYEAASKSFADALDASEGKVGKTQYDILKYRAEVSFKLSDYERAAETWRKLKILDEDPENQSEYDNLIMTCDAAAAKMSVLVCKYIVMKPPYEAPKQPMRSGLTNGWASQNFSVPSIMLSAV